MPTGQLQFMTSPPGYCYQAMLGTSQYAVIRSMNNTNPTQSWVAVTMTGAGSVIGSYATREAAMNACQTNYGPVGNLGFFPPFSDTCTQAILGPAADTYAIIRTINSSTPAPTMYAFNLGGAGSVVGTYGSRNSAQNAIQIIYNALSS